MYKCVNEFTLETIGDYIENKEFKVEKGSIWTVVDTNYRLIDGELRLESQDGIGWIEIQRKTLSKMFEIIKP